MGAPPEVIEKKCGTDVFEVDYQNWDALRVFQSCATQWRVIAHMSGVIYQGLEYTAVESVMRMLRIKKPHKSFLSVQFIERGYLEKMGEKR